MKQKGFTLIELLVVISIIGFTAAIALAAMNSARIRARDAKRVADMALIIKAAEVFYDSQGQYPYATGGAATWDGHWNLMRDCLQTGTNCGFSVSNYTPLTATIPNDPLDNPATLSDADPTYYTGWENRAPNNFIIRMLLENSNHQALENDADGAWRNAGDNGCNDPWYCTKINFPI